jgi:hypothetical protein
MKIKIDLHVHTHYSRCSWLKPERIEKIALRCGLDMVAVTDHNTLQGARAAAACARSIKIIAGEEIRTACGEITGYFLHEEIPPGLSPGETIAEIRRQGGLVSVPHPFDRLRSSRMQRDALAAIVSQIDMIEIFNARDILTRRDDRLLERAREAGVVPVVSSDAHLGIEIGRAYVIIDDFTSPREFLQNLRAARQVSRKSPLWVHLVTKIIRAYKKRPA